MPTHALPVTVAATRRAGPDRDDDLERWAADLCAAAGAFPGSMRCDTRRSRAGGPLEITVSVTFDSAASAYDWERSGARAALVARGDELTEGDVVSALLQPPGPAIPRWRTALIVWAGLFPFALALNAWVTPLAELPVVVRTLVSTAVLVPLAIYVGIPLVQRALRLGARRR